MTGTLIENTPESIAHRARWAHIAKSFISRAELQGLKGKKRDNAAMEFFCGAATVTEANDHGGSVMAFLVAVKGYREVLELAKLADGDA